MSKDLELKAWLVQEAAFDYYKHGQKGPVSQDDDVRAYLQLYQLLDDVEANKSQPMSYWSAQCLARLRDSNVLEK